jgi:hypothetical protein
MGVLGLAARHDLGLQRSTKFRVDHDLVRKDLRAMLANMSRCGTHAMRARHDRVKI